MMVSSIASGRPMMMVVVMVMMIMIGFLMMMIFVLVFSFLGTRPQDFPTPAVAGPVSVEKDIAKELSAPLMLSSSQVEPSRARARAEPSPCRLFSTGPRPIAESSRADADRDPGRCSRLDADRDSDCRPRVDAGRVTDCWSRLDTGRDLNRWTRLDADHDHLPGPQVRR